MTRRQLLTTATAAIAAPALAALPAEQTSFEVRVAYTTEGLEPEKDATVFCLTYHGPKGTQELWGVVQKNGRYLVTDLSGAPVDSTTASLASMAMAVYFIPGGERPLGKRYTYTLRTRRKVKPAAHGPRLS